jgi:putative alpha-1,2-mannosidase
LVGNDDGGTLAAWYVFTAIGLYPWPCVPGYYVTAPSFDRAVVRLAGGATLTVLAQGAGAGQGYATSATFNGQPVEGWWIPHQDLVQGGTLEMTMSQAP